jgi:hypothetical protein
LIAETKTMARVSHPNVCAMYDAGGKEWRRRESKTENMSATMTESAESREVTVPLVDARVPSAPSTVPAVAQSMAAISAR